MSDDTTVPDLGPATGLVTTLLGGVDAAHLTAPTPSDYPVAQLLDHFMGLTLAFTQAAAKIRSPMTTSAPRPTAADLDPDWRRLLPARLTALAGAWRDPAAWRGVTMAGGVEFPAEVMGLVALNEVTIHGWDLARATGQSFEPDSETLGALLPFLAQSADDQAAREGMFGPVVEVPPDAPMLDRVIGLAGRDPEWTP